MTKAGETGGLCGRVMYLSLVKRIRTSTMEKVRSNWRGQNSPKLSSRQPTILGQYHSQSRGSYNQRRKIDG